MGTPPRHEFIVKIQKPLSPPGATECLIYNQDRSVKFVSELRVLPDYVRRVLAEAPKGYFLAAKRGPNVLELLDEAPAQSW